MSRTLETPAEKAERFLVDASQFRLGHLLTESPHPRSTTLSDVARRRAADGLAMLFDVDRDVVETYDRWSRSDSPRELADRVTASLLAGGRLFFTGCGATGRLSIQLASIWRGFWQRRRARALTVPSPDAWEHRAFSVMAGGDYALIKSVEGFEDFAPFGRRQLADLGVTRGDVVFAITEGGETSFVIGTAWEGLDKGADVVFVYNNPDDILREHVQRSREVIDEPRIRKVNLTTGPMAVTGSTRMQATSIQLLVMLTVLEMALRNVLAHAGATACALGPAAEVPHEMRDGLAALHARLTTPTFLDALGDLVCAEEQVYRSGGRVSYFADSLAIDVLTDTTERSPTFCLPSFRKCDDTRAADSWAFLFTPAAQTAQAWERLLRRVPQTIEWTTDDLKALLDEEAADRQATILSEIGHRDLMRFRIALDGLPYRPMRAGDDVTAVATADDVDVLSRDHAFAECLRSARDADAEVSLISVGTVTGVGRVAATAVGQIASRRADVVVSDVPFLLDPLVRIGTKMVLNALSTCVMVRMGRVLGNRMIWVVPSNLKLIDRSIRYIRDLAGVSYDEACHALFEVIEYVDPRRSAGQTYPSPVGVATMRLKHRLDLPAAEARLYAELS